MASGHQDTAENYLFILIQRHLSEIHVNIILVAEYHGLSYGHISIVETLTVFKMYRSCFKFHLVRILINANMYIIL